MHEYYGREESVFPKRADSVSSNPSPNANGLNRTVLVFDNALDNDNVCALAPSKNLFTGEMPLSSDD